ncbi:MAG: acyltransferase domain-containing protein, partial [Oscillospiraceae bacterium]|nr:acyltransferase domain-containing protein [Oscillospiraceae bacterium]
MKIAFCYPGQGVQQIGMAQGFVETSPDAAAMLVKASEAADIDMARLLFEENDDINITEFTQPALVTACCIITDALLKAGVKPEVTAGLSLGEYCSLYAAGALSFEDAVRLTRIRGRLMSSAVPAGEGSMAAVIGLDKETVEGIT